MKPLTRDEVSESVANALESIAFVLAEPGGPSDQQYSRHARIRYDGPGESSELLLSATDGSLVELASNLIGVDPDAVSPEQEGLQALTELANIVC